VTEFLANNLPKIWIASYSEASQLLTSETGDAIAHIISIGEPGSTPPPGYSQVPHRLRLEFDDIVALNDDEPDYVLATSEHIRQVIDFVPINITMDIDIIQLGDSIPLNHFFLVTTAEYH
jgi:predicted protein tyrosine phosphatase